MLGLPFGIMDLLNGTTGTEELHGRRVNKRAGHNLKH